MPSLWVPNAAADSILADQGHAEASRFVSFRQRLKAMDSRMDAFLCDQTDPDGELRIGFYYLFRRNDNGTVAFFEVSDEKGGFLEPGDWLIDRLQMVDRDTVFDLRDRHEARKREAEKARADRNEEIEARVADQSDYMFRVQHAFPSLPWKDK